MYRLAVKHQKVLKSLPDDIDEETIRPFIDIIVFSSSNPETRLVACSNLKKYLNGERPDLMRFHCIPPGLVEQVKVIRQEKLRRKPTKFVPRSVVRNLLALERTESSHESKMCWLQVTSGRRISEIHHGDFEVHGDELVALSLSKKRESSGYWVIKLLDADPYEWLAVWLLTAEYRSARTLNNINGRCNALLGSRFSLTSHNLRGIYACEMYSRSGMTRIKTGFIQDILHLDSQDVSMHYTTFTIVEDQ
jgi:hypothetical protein